MEPSARGAKLSAWAAEVGRRRSADAELTFEDSSSMLRDLMTRGLVKMTDLRDDPEWFFEAHRIVAAHGDDLGSGFWTRFTVQFNLFAGTVLAAGSPSHVEQLRAMQAAGELGCFALTEKFAGVSSGMVVETVAAFDAASRTFVLRSPNEGAVKNWISQGFCADKSVVIADLQLEDGVSQGAHAFLIDFRVSRGSAAKQLVAGVRLADMGRKTTANDLDNAWCAVAAAPCGLGTPTPPHLPPPPPAPQALPVPASPLRIAEDRLPPHPSPTPPQDRLRRGARARVLPARPLLVRRRRGAPHGAQAAGPGRRPGARRRARGGARHDDDWAAPLLGTRGRRAGPAARAHARARMHARTYSHTRARACVRIYCGRGAGGAPRLLPGDPTSPVCRRRWSSGGISSPSAAATRTPSCAGRPGACARPSRCSRS